MVAVLVGFMGAGKTTVGHIIAERLGQPFVDSDVLIEQRLGRNIREIFATEGETYFRELEHATVAELVRGQEAVIALGGGAVEDPRTRALLRNARVIYLRVDYDEAMSRVQGDEYRPMLHRPDLDQVYQRRLPVYEDLSVLTIDTGGRRPDAIAREVLAELTRLPTLPPNSSSVFVTPVGGTYYAHVGPGLTGRVDSLLPALPEVERGMIIEADEDAGVAARVAEGFAAAGIGVHRVALPDTQASKSFQTAEYLADAFADHAIHRGDLVIAVGGEAICDIAGFVAGDVQPRPAPVPGADDAGRAGRLRRRRQERDQPGPRAQPGGHHPPARRRDQRHRGGLRATPSVGSSRAWPRSPSTPSSAPSDLLGYLHGARGPIVSRDPAAVCAAAYPERGDQGRHRSRDERDQGEPPTFLNYGHDLRPRHRARRRLRRRADPGDGVRFVLTHRPPSCHRRRGHPRARAARPRRPLNQNLSTERTVVTPSGDWARVPVKCAEPRHSLTDASGISK